MFNRKIFPEKYATGEALSRDLAGLGFLFTKTSVHSPNIEDTLVAASIEGVTGDYRVLSMLVDWLEIHAFNINADRLITLVMELDDSRVRHFWCAIGQMQASDVRFKRLAELYRSRVDLMETGTSFQIERKGEDPRFKGTALRVAKGSLRHRPEDILPPAKLAKLHLGYRFRVQMGPSYRADMWALLEVSQGALSAAEVAKAAYGSYSTARKVRQDWNLLRTSLAS